MRDRGRRAFFTLAIIVAALATVASVALAGLPKRDYGAATAKLAGVPGASVGFYALTKKLLSAHGRPTSVAWAGLTNVPITCMEGTLKMSNHGSFYEGTANPVRVNPSGAFTFDVQLSAYGYTGITMTVVGRFADHYKKVSGTVSLVEDPSPATYYGGSTGDTPYTNCTVASTPYTQRKARVALRGVLTRC
ncbi:MAG TPA: hypothetical protein VH061_09735 [Solirubrobacteraceae bacterium]|nr:hypothetical protein [Solirubrobacteraceae bacterium]